MTVTIDSSKLGEKRPVEPHREPATPERIRATVLRGLEGNGGEITVAAVVAILITPDVAKACLAVTAWKAALKQGTDPVGSRSGLRLARRRRNQLILGLLEQVLAEVRVLERDRLAYLDPDSSPRTIGKPL